MGQLIMIQGVEFPKDSTLQADLDAIARFDLPWSELKHSCILVTGATGLIGSQVVRALLASNRINTCGMKILAMVRSRQKAERVFGTLLQHPELNLIVGDILDPIQVSDDVHYIIHTASQTKSKQLVEAPVQAIDVAVNGTKHILDFACRKQCRGVVYLSSMEVYGDQRRNKGRATEDQLGDIDLFCVRSCYPESKRMCENLCVCYAAQYGIPVKIARLAQTFGAGVSMEETRVFAQFAKAVMRNENIVLHTEGKSMGNYCYTADAVCGILKILMRGCAGQAYNVVSEAATMTIGEMAQLVADKVSGGVIQVKFDIPASAMTYGYLPDVTLRLDGTKLRSLGWFPSIAPDLETMYRRMIESFRAQETLM